MDKASYHEILALCLIDDNEFRKRVNDPLFRNWLRYILKEANKNGCQKSVGD